MASWIDRKLCCLALGALLFTPGLYANLDPRLAITQYTQDSWGTESGLPTNRILGLAQTSDGYLWLATEEGLVRFDRG